MQRDGSRGVPARDQGPRAELDQAGRGARALPSDAGAGREVSTDVYASQYKRFAACVFSASSASASSSPSASRSSAAMASPVGGRASTNACFSATDGAHATPNQSRSSKLRRAARKPGWAHRSASDANACVAAPHARTRSGAWRASTSSVAALASHTSGSA